LHDISFTLVYEMGQAAPIKDSVKQSFTECQALFAKKTQIDLWTVWGRLWIACGQWRQAE
jgi:hypothetical protein